MPHHAVDFQQLVQRVQRATVDATEVAIWGGTCHVTQLLELLDAWKAPSDTMPFCMWMYISEIAFQRQQRPHNIEWLQRGRVFGEAGDLDIRRNGDQFDWRFIGLPDTQSVDDYPADNNFWTFEPHARFHRYTKRVLLWGERSDNMEYWHEDRVANANLRYPISTNGSRVWIQYDAFSRQGITEFVWFTGLTTQEADNA